MQGVCRRRETRAQMPGSWCGGYCMTMRALRGCTGRLLAWCITFSKAAICVLAASTGCFIISHSTPSEQGGVVSEPLKR